MTDSNDDVAVIVLAAGRSSRMGGGDKLWADLGGSPVIAHSMRTLAGLEGVAAVVVVGPVERHDDFRQLVGANVDVRCVAGGERRQDSVAAGIAACPDAGWYLVHDGARPLVTAEVARRVLEGARVHGAAVPGVAVADTLKRIDDGARVIETVDRESVRAIQTPQGFAGALLRRAHTEVRRDVTDDASMVEALGEPVTVVEGDAANLKVTRPIDLEIARALLAMRENEQG